ncbi:MAG: DNA double-strand break repair nuclease NurA [Promethearchaeota archaeon]|nr:MAG: DNA double-strand break repair nuclease NurA [Candidatus Lokiarchaeota archaeon]
MIKGRDYFSSDKETKNKINKGHPLNKIGATKEDLLLNQIENIAIECKEIENLKNAFTQAILSNLEKLNFNKFINHPKYYIKESNLIKKVESSNIRGLSIVSVDGSSVIKKFMNIDISFLKAIAVKYYFYENKKARINYFPDFNGFNNYDLQVNLMNQDDNYVDTKSSLDMTYMEIHLLNELIKDTPDIDLIIIDGSVVIMPINLLFSKDPNISNEYDFLLKEYHKLYQNCKKNGIILLGSIKDTRTSALNHLIRDSIQYLKPTHNHLEEFINLNYRETMNYFSDLDLFNRLLKKNERSCIFNCKTDVDKIRDTGIKKEIPYYFPLDFYAFYLKTTEYDMPCRIEFFIEENHQFEEATRKADLISKILLPISNLNEVYGLPIPQIEAHRRAVFTTQEINLLFDNLRRKLNKYGINLLKKRRDRRPF